MIRMIALLTCIIFSFPSILFAKEMKSYQVSFEKYQLPNITLINQDGKRVNLTNIINSDKPVIVQFIFATCTTICPVLSAGYSNLQSKIGNKSDKIQLVSISIDPENDTPKVMKEYLKRYRAKSGWDFYTGSRSSIEAVMKSFNAYIENKMSHYAVTLMHKKGDTKWKRVTGIMSSSEFIQELKSGGYLF